MRENSQRDTFIFYRSFKESMNELSDADKLIMYEAISDYSLDMKEPELTGFPNLRVFPSTPPALAAASDSTSISKVTPPTRLSSMPRTAHNAYFILFVFNLRTDISDFPRKYFQICPVTRIIFSSPS